MWPVLTLTLLLQLTDEEQLFATITLEEASPAVQVMTTPPDPLAEEDCCDAFIG